MKYYTAYLSIYLSIYLPIYPPVSRLLCSITSNYLSLSFAWTCIRFLFTSWPYFDSTSVSCHIPHAFCCPVGFIDMGDINFFVIRFVYLKRTSIAASGPTRATFGSSSATSSSSTGGGMGLPTKASFTGISSSGIVQGPHTSHNLPNHNPKTAPSSLRSSPTVFIPGSIPAAATDIEDDEDFTLLIGMDEDDSSGDEEVLEEG